MRPPRVLALASLAWLSACGARTPLRTPDAEPAVDVRDARAPDVPDVLVIPDVLDVPDIPDVPPPPELCGDGVDNDGDGLTDEGCPVCISAGLAPWRMHRAQGPVCFGRTFTTHGDPAEYAFARIPGEGDPGWSPRPLTRIDFSESSVLCDRECTCLNGGEFTYFETTVIVPDGFRVASFAVSAESVDDGVRVTVFNDRFPAGATDPRAFATFGGPGFSVRLERYLAPGRNRVVLTHLDDCCSARYLTGVDLRLNDGVLTQCL